MVGQVGYGVANYLSLGHVKYHHKGKLCASAVDEWELLKTSGKGRPVLFADSKIIQSLRS